MVSRWKPLPMAACDPERTSPLVVDPLPRFDPRSASQPNSFLCTAFSKILSPRTAPTPVWGSLSPQV